MTCEMIHKNMVHGWNALVDKGTLVVQGVAVSVRLLYPKVAQKYEALVLHFATIYEREMRRIHQNENERLQREISLLRYQVVNLKKQVNQFRPTEDPSILKENQQLMEEEMRLNVRLNIEEEVEKRLQKVLDESKNNQQSLKKEIAALQPRYASEEDVRKREEKDRQRVKGAIKSLLVTMFAPPSAGIAVGFVCVWLCPAAALVAVTGTIAGTSVAICQHNLNSNAQ